MSKNEFQLFDLYQEGIVVERNGQVIYANAAAGRFFGRQLVGEQIQSVFPATLTQFSSAHFTSSVQLCGKICTVNVSQQDKQRIFSVLLSDGLEGDHLLAAIGNVVHNQAAIVQLSSSFLRPHIEELENEKLNAYTAMLNHSCRQMLRLAEHMAILSKNSIDTHLPREYPVLDLCQLCGDLVDVLQMLSPVQNIHLILDRPDHPVLFAGPQERIEQMLLNLLSNSLKYTPEGGTITLQVKDAAGGPCLTVTDTGSGIAGDKLLNIFQTYCTPPVLTDPKRGVGLGLTVARRIAEYLGGTLLLESRIQEGTRVTIQLPDNTTHRDLMMCEPAPPAPDGLNKILTELSDVLDYTSFYAKYED